MIKNILKVAASALLFLLSVGANAAQLCDGGRLNNSRPLTILFVNGIFNDDVRSCLSSTNLRGAAQLDSAKYNFDYIHNPDSWADTIELNEQQEISGAAVLETFRLYGKYDKKSYYIELGRAYKSKISAGNNKAIFNFTKALVEKLNALIAAGQRIVVVPHSQGNYYIEAAYAVLMYEAFMTPDLESKLDRIRVVGVANVAHTTPNDRYITIIEDRAIAGLEVQTILIGNSAAKPMERNNAICNSLFDIGCLNRVTVADPPSRHDFNLIYLSRFLKDPLLDLSLQDIVSIKVKQSIAELESKIPPNDVIYTLEAAFTSNRTLSAPWSFGWQVSSGAAPIPYASFQPAGSRTDYPTLAIWNKVSGSAGSPPIDVYPWVVKNTGASPVLYSPLAASFPGQSVIVTPGSSGEKAVFRWTAPTAGMYEIIASYELMQGGEVDVHVQRNGVDIFSAIIARQGSQAIVPAQTVTLSVGDTVDFVVGNGGNTQNSDMTRVSASVKSVSGNGVNSGAVTVQANTIPGATVTVPNSVSACTFVSSGSWSAGQFAPPQYQNADGVVGGNSLNLTNFGVPMPAEPNMALVVKRSSTNQFVLLGSSKTIQVLPGETLSFMMNDSTIPLADYTANTGQLTTRWNCQ